MRVADRIDHVLETHHAFLHRELDPLTEALEAARVDLKLLTAWRELAELLREHLWKEERILFPAALGGQTPCGLQGPIRQMRYEHEIIDRMVDELRGRLGVAGALADRVQAVLDDLDVHARYEDEELFPAILGG